MPISSKKAPQSAAAGTASTSGTGGSAYFRRKKIVPAVVARKISNNNTKNTAKIASCKEISTNIPTHEESSATLKEATETVDLQQQTTQTLEAVADVTLNKPTLQAEESKGVKMPEAQKSNTTTKLPAAFRRIKPKVVIPQTQKPAKSILKNPTTPVKGNSGTESTDVAESSNETSDKNDSKLAAHGEIIAEKDLPKQTPQSEESVKSKQETSVNQSKSMQPTDKNELDPVLSKTNVNIEGMISSQTSEQVANADEVKKCPDVQNSSTLEKGQSNSSVPVVSSQTTSIPLGKMDKVTTVSIPPAEDTSKQHIPESTPHNAKTATATKTIKRTISLSTLSPEIANMLKSSLGKKTPKGTKSLHANSKATVSKQSELSKPLPSVSLLPKASQANQENQTQTQLVVAPSDKPKSIEDNVTVPSAGDRLPVLENRVDNIASKETIVTKPKSPVKPAPSPAKLPASGQITGVKKIQKVHQLTAEQQRLVLNSLKKGKVKRSAKMPDVAPVTKDNNVATAQEPIKSTLNAPSNESTGLSTVIIPPTPTVCSVPKDEHRVNIISHIILPRLTVSSPGEAAKQSVFNPSDLSVTVPAASHSSPTAVPTAPSPQLTGFMAGTSSTLSSNNSNQYPKLFICHKPAPSVAFGGETMSSPILQQFPTPASPVEARSQLIQPSVSVTVLPTTNHPVPGYPSNSVPSRPYFLPTPVVTVQPTTPKHTAYANTAHTSPLPTPIISVTVSPMGSSSSSATPVKVRVDPRIVPKIVIDGCDANDHDSQSSLTSTSSSSSSVQATPALKKESKDRSVSIQTSSKDRTDVGTGCSPYTLHKLRAKSLKNLRMKIGNIIPRVVDKNSSATPIRQYGSASNLKGLRGNTETNVQHDHTVNRIVDRYNKLLTESTTIIPGKPEPPDVSVCDSEPAKTNCEQAKVLEKNDFLGFSTSSIECAVRDFKHKTRMIDSVLEARRKSLEDAKGHEMAIEGIETGALNEESKREPTPPLPMTEVMEEPAGESVAKTASNDQNRTDSTDPPQTDIPSGKNKTSSVHDESETNTQKIDPEAGSLQDEEAATKKVPINVTTPKEIELAKEQIIILDSGEEVENEPNKQITTVENENATNGHETNVPQEIVVDANRSDESNNEDLEVVLGGTAASGEVNEPLNTVNPNVETTMEEEDPTISAPESSDKTMTGVDVIMAMAKLRRENRVLSLDDGSDREDIGWMDEPIATPTKLTTPPNAGEQLGKKKRKRRRKKSRDKFVELLLKHVNYDTLIEDLVNQEKRRCNYVSSSDEEVRTISPLQRYIREQEREQERSAAIVEAGDYLSTPTITSEDDESLVEETILNRILSKRACVSDAPDVSSTPLQIEQTAVCSGTPQKVICADSDDGTLSPGVPDEQGDDVERSNICDKAAEDAAAVTNKAPTLRELSDIEMEIVDPIPLPTDDFSLDERYKSCDKIVTNAATCDTPSGAVVEKEAIEPSSLLSNVVKTINTHAEQVQLQRRTRRTLLRRASCRKRSPAKRLATRMVSYADKRKRPRYNITPPVEMPLFDSSDAFNIDEVVSDCSSDGLSTGEVLANNTRSSLPARKLSMGNGNGSVVVDEGGVRDESKANIRGKGLSVVAVARDTSNRPGRSRKSERRHSSSSNSISSNTRPNSLSCDGDLSSSDETKPGRRRKLRRKKRSTRGGPRANRAPEEVKEEKVGTNDATVDYDTKRSLSTTTSSNTSNIRTHLPTASSKPSKASNLDAQYVITEVASKSATAPPRVLDVINVRNNRVLSTGAPSTRSNRTTNVLSNPQESGKDAPKRHRNRSAKKSNQAANVESEEFITPNSTIDDWQQQSTASEKNATGESQSEPAPSEPMDADELGNQPVTCGNCGKEMLQSSWQDHCGIHNGATFRVGIDTPLDMKDVKAVSGAIARFMKLQRRAEVACERCGIVKKSGLGMASHMNQCGLSDQELEQSKMTCVHCGRKMKAVSLLIHQQQYCRVLKEQQRQIALTTPMEEPIPTKETTASGRRKRKSVAKAEKKIKTIAKETIDELNGELVLEVYGRGVSNAIMQCWLSHLKQSSEAVCAYLGCPFFGMTSAHMQTEYNDDAADPKPLYQCAKCAYMSTNQDPIYEHLSIVHPQTLRRVAEQRHMMSNFTSDGDSDVCMVSGNDSTSADDTFSSSALEEEDEGRPGGKSKKGKGKKQTSASSNKSKSKKSKSESPKSNSKKSTGKQTGGSKAISSELLDTTIASVGTEETEVYKEMVLQESIEYKQGKGNYHLMTVNWTQEFRREHYAVRLLFSDLRPDVDLSYLRAVNNLRDYLPKATQSLRYVQCNSKQYDPVYEPEMFANRWQQSNTFEGEALGCESIFYCGGPVVSIDWLPLPDDCGNECDQFLAVACKQSYDEYYNGEELAIPRSRKSLVQIWNVGPIQNLGTTKITLRSPRLAFAIACEYGPIWQVAFCPSGCYNDPAQGDDLDRLGLLAVAGSDGDVHLYALSRSMAATESDNSTAAPRILPLQPVLLLSLSVTVGPQISPASDFTGRSVVRITWSREKGHTVLAAGYSNGVVAVWNLAATSPLLCGMKNGIRTLLPVHKILHSSSGCITALDLHYSAGSRYLVVCNVDRRLKVYDLRSSLYQPQESLSIIMRSRVASVRWLLHFPVLVIAYDDALYIDRCAYSVHQPRDIGLRMFSIFTVGSEMTDLGPNDWYSVNAVATSGGDLVCHRPVPFVYGMNYKKLAQILTTTIPMKLNAIDDSVDVSRYKSFSQEYGLLFSDTDKVPTAMDTAALHLKTWHRAKFNHYPAIRLNQIRWNPNSSSYMYYAIGYQAGFVRVRVLRT
uniref:Uncharacterized protein n=1 Tax=Anopheles funestus TaxID=62324 RepID=A0A4Y0BIB9_ANOFN